MQNKPRLSDNVTRRPSDGAVRRAAGSRTGAPQGAHRTNAARGVSSFRDSASKTHRNASRTSEPVGSSRSGYYSRPSVSERRLYNDDDFARSPRAAREDYSDAASLRDMFKTSDERRAAHPEQNYRPSGRSVPRGRNPAPVRRAAPPRRPQSRRALRLRRRRRIALAAAALAVALIAFFCVRYAAKVGLIRPTFNENVYIGNVSFAEYNYEQGLAYAEQLENEWRSTVYSMQWLDHTWDFTRADFDGDIDYEGCLQSAWNLGHVGNVFQRSRVVDSLKANPLHLEPAIEYSEAKLDAFIDEICAAIDVDAVDAVVVPDVDSPVVVSESKTGLKVNREQLKEQMVALIVTGESDTAIPVETLFPAVSSDDVNSQVIAQLSTDVSFRNSASRANVRLSLSAFNGLTVNPGETISVDEVIGPRTAERGYQLATEYSGDTTTKGYGGGVCQTSTTLYGALTSAGMTILERSKHGMTVSYVEPSQDAALDSTSGKDLVFRNDTEYPIYIYTSVTSELATVTIYGHRPEYRYVLESVIIEENVPSTRMVTVEDYEGTKVYYTDEMPVIEEGKPGCVSEGWVVAYDWDTGEEVSRTKVSHDTYQPAATICYVGTHSRFEAGEAMEY